MSMNGTTRLAIVPSPLIDPPFQKTAEWEKFDYLYWIQWVDRNWTLGIYLSLAYVGVIFALQRFMKNRQPVHLRETLIFWNAAMALFSASASYRYFPSFYDILSNKGFHASVCERHMWTMTQEFWQFLVLWSKIAEFGDTIFIVLRKKPLLLLQWYHHAIVCILTFFGYSTYDPLIRWYFMVNLSIHALMYSYYTARAVGMKVPRIFAMTITTLQITQFMIGIPCLSFYSAYSILKGWPCDRVLRDILLLEWPVGVSFFILFTKYFMETYVKGKRRPELKSKTN